MSKPRKIIYNGIVYASAREFAIDAGFTSEKDIQKFKNYLSKTDWNIDETLAYMYNEHSSLKNDFDRESEKLDRLLDNFESLCQRHKIVYTEEFKQLLIWHKDLNKALKEYRENTEWNNEVKRSVDYSKTLDYIDIKIDKELEEKRRKEEERRIAEDIEQRKEKERQKKEEIKQLNLDIEQLKLEVSKTKQEIETANISKSEIDARLKELRKIEKIIKKLEYEEEYARVRKEREELKAEQMKERKKLADKKKKEQTKIKEFTKSLRVSYDPYMLTPRVQAKLISIGECKVNNYISVKIIALIKQIETTRYEEVIAKAALYSHGTPGGRLGRALVDLDIGEARKLYINKFSTEDIALYMLRTTYNKLCNN